jgi:hypothetical protein
MLKQSLIYLVLSFMVVFFASYVSAVILYIDVLYAYINYTFMPFFHSLGLNVLFRQVFILVLLPIAIVAVPYFYFKFIKKKPMPYALQISWIIWLIIALSNILIR